MTFQVAFTKLADNKTATWTNNEMTLIARIPQAGTVVLTQILDGEAVMDRTFTSPHTLVSTLDRLDALEGWTI